MIKGVFFDAAGILYTRAGPTEAYALELLRKGGFSTVVSPEQLDQLLALRSKANQGFINHQVYWDQFLLKREVLDHQERRSMIEQIIDYSNDVQPSQGWREALAGLKQRGFLLGIITDTMYPVEFKMSRLEKVGVAEFIDVLACSTVLGVHKPDPAVYSAAMQQAHLAPAQSAFVGHLGSELQGANHAGMTTIAINQDADAKADFYCNSLLDLLLLSILDHPCEE